MNLQIRYYYSRSLGSALHFLTFTLLVIRERLCYHYSAKPAQIPLSVWGGFIQLAAWLNIFYASTPENGTELVQILNRTGPFYKFRSVRVKSMYVFNFESVALKVNNLCNWLETAL